MPFLGHRVPLPTTIFLLDHLRVMLHGGVPIGRAVESLATDAGRPALTAALGQVRAAIERGQPLADALAAHPTIIPPIAVELIRSGEQSGTLESSLREVAAYLRKEYELRSRVRSALLYPTIVVAAMVVIGVGVVVIVLPKLLDLFRGVTTELPFATRALIATASFTRAYGTIIAVVLLAAIAAAVVALRTPNGRAALHRAVLRFPGSIGVLAREVNLTRMLRTLSGLLRTAIPIVRALELTAGTIRNTAYRHSVAAAAQRVARGEPLSRILRENPARFPPTVTQVVAVGEDTSTLDDLLGELADFYDADVDRMLRNLTTIIEPLLMVAIGIAVAFLAVAVLQPMYSLAQAI